MSFLDAALGFSERGWFVFPLKQGEKIPATGHGFKDAVNDALKIKATWHGLPNANIGIATGKVSGISVIDIDGADGVQSAKQMDGQFPKTLVLKTPHGYHLVYSYHPDLHTGAGFLPGVDVRSDGGYIVGPGSVVGGVKYEVLYDRPIVSLPSVPDIFQFRTRQSQAVLPRFDTEQALAGVPEGQRDETIFKLAAKLRNANVPEYAAIQLVRQAAANCVPPFDAVIAESKVKQVYQRYQAGPETHIQRQYREIIERRRIKDAPEYTFENESYIFRWASSEVTFTLENTHFDKEGLHSVMHVHCTQVGKEFPLPRKNLNWYAARSVSDYTKELNKRGKDVEWADMMDSIGKIVDDLIKRGEPSINLQEIGQSEPPEYLIHPLVMADVPTIVFGLGGSGKSETALTVMASLHTGLDFGFGVPKYQVRGLYVDYEGTERAITYRLDALCRGMGYPDGPGGRPDIEYLRCSAPLAHIVDQVRRLITEKNIGFVVIDSIVPSCTGKPEEADVAREWFAAVRKLGERVTVIGVAHHAKNQEDAKTPFGSAFWHNLARATWKVTSKMEPGSGELLMSMEHTKANDDGLYPSRGYNILFNKALGTTTVKQIDVEEIQDQIKKRKYGAEDLLASILDCLSNAPSTGTTYLEIADQCESKPNIIKATMNRHKKLFKEIIVVGQDKSAPKRWKRA